MAGCGHFYVTAHGEFTGVWQGEIAQVGLRVLARNLGAPAGPIVDVQDLGSVEQVYEDVNLTNFNAVQTFKVNLPGSNLPTITWMEDIAEDLRAWMTAVKANQGNTFKWTHIKFAPIEKGTGKYLAPSSIFTLKAAIVGQSTNGLPPECSVALSTRAGIVGKRGRGRIYLPNPSVATGDATGKVTSASRTSLANSFRDLIQAIEDSPGVDQFTANVAVMSAPNLTAVIPSEVRVGDHFDVQRRRQHQVAEAYTALPL